MCNCDYKKEDVTLFHSETEKEPIFISFILCSYMFYTFQLIFARAISNADSPILPISIYYDFEKLLTAVVVLQFQFWYY